MYQFLLSLWNFWDDPPNHTAGQLPKVARQGWRWMLLATAFHVLLWVWAVPVLAQTSSGEPLALSRYASRPDQARLVVYRTVNDELPEYVMVRINASYLSNLQRASFVVLCLPPQSAVLQLSAEPASGLIEPIEVSVSLELGQTRYILAGDAPDRALVMYGLSAENARDDLGDAQAEVRTRNRFKEAQPCTHAQDNQGDIHVTEAAKRTERMGNSRAQ